MISVSPADGFPGYVVTDDGTGRDVLFQTDWDYPALAQTFGASLRSLVPVMLRNARGRFTGRCSHDSTDGSVTCRGCGAKVGAFIAAAADYLDNGPDPVEDPGYFSSDE